MSPETVELVLQDPTYLSFANWLEHYLGSIQASYYRRRGAGITYWQEFYVDEWTRSEPPAQLPGCIYELDVTAVVVDDPDPAYYPPDPPGSTVVSWYTFQVFPLNDLSRPGIQVSVATRASDLPEFLDRLVGAIAERWPEARQQLERQGISLSPREIGPVSAYDSSSEGSAIKAEDKRPWERIRDCDWHRTAVKLWWQGLSVPQIAAQTHVEEQTIRNVFTNLRHEYGTEVVPYLRDLKRMGMR